MKDMTKCKVVATTKNGRGSVKITGYGLGLMVIIVALIDTVSERLGISFDEVIQSAKDLKETSVGYEKE